MHRESPRMALTSVRVLIDSVDDGLVALLAARRHLVAIAKHCKQHSGDGSRDILRESEVRIRAQRLGRRLGMPASSSDRLMRTVIEDACAQQGLDEHTNTISCDSPDLDQGNRQRTQTKLPPIMQSSPFNNLRPFLLRLLPPPSRLAPVMKRIPYQWQARAIGMALQKALETSLSGDTLLPLEARRIGIEVSDLGLAWVLRVADGRLEVCAQGEKAEAIVRGTATDLLLLASRLEDADTLFFQRKLELTGDTELGLTARNLLDRMPWESIPLGLRIVLHRSAKFMGTARSAHRQEP